MVHARAQTRSQRHALSMCAGIVCIRARLASERARRPRAPARVFPQPPHRDLSVFEGGGEEFWGFRGEIKRGSTGKG